MFGIGNPNRRPQVDNVVAPAEPSRTEPAPKAIDRGEVLAMLDAFTYEAHKCGARGLADLIQDQRLVLKPVRRPTVVARPAS